MKIFPRHAKTTPVEKTPGPSGKTLELREIPRRTVIVLHENRRSERYAKISGGAANRAARRALGRARGTITPRPIYTPYEAPLAGSDAFEAQARLYARGAVAVYR